MPQKSKADRTAYNQEYYKRNKDKYLQRATASRKAFREKWLAYKASLQCTQCGENHPATLDFHHVIRLPENQKVYALVAKYSWKAVMEEIKKCVVLCSNCHRKLHAEEHKHKAKS